MEFSVFFVYSVFHVVHSLPSCRQRSVLSPSAAAVNGDSYAWIRHATGDGAGCAGLLSPDLSLRIGGFELGPLLSRSLRGGLFSIREGGRIIESRAVQLAPMGAQDPGDEALREFARQSQAQMRPGITRVYTSGVDRGVRWVQTERVSGWSLRTLLGRREIAVTGRRLAMLGAELADALVPLHASGAAFGFVHGRLGTGHVLVDRAGRLRLCGVPVARSVSAMPDAIGVGAIVACSALGVCPDPRGVTLATARALANALDRPENVARSPLGLRRLVQSLLVLHPCGFLPAMAVVREQFLAFADGLPLGVPDPAWGRSLCEAVRGLSPSPRPTPADVEGVLEELAPYLPELSSFLPVLFVPAECGAAEPADTTARAALRESEAVPDCAVPQTGRSMAALAPAGPAARGEAHAPDIPPGQRQPVRSTAAEVAPPAFDVPILPSLHDPVDSPRPRSLRQRIFPLLVG